jgi:hypothetical protein
MFHLYCELLLQPACAAAGAVAELAWCHCVIQVERGGAWYPVGPPAVQVARAMLLARGPERCVYLLVPRDTCHNRVF